MSWEDDVNDIRQGKGNGYKDDDGTVCMIRCFQCGRENWAPAVATGHCAWCGFDPNKPDDEPKDAA
jgi:ribosomal protein L37E